MTKEWLRQISESLLAHLSLSASEAAVFVDQRTSEDALVVYIYDRAASRRVQSVTNWNGFPVSIVKNVDLHTRQRSAAGNFASPR